MSQRQPVVGAVIIVRAAIFEIRSHDGYETSLLQAAMKPGEKRVDLFRIPQMLKEIGHEDAFKVIRREVYIKDVAFNKSNAIVRNGRQLQARWFLQVDA